MHYLEELLAERQLSKRHFTKLIGLSAHGTIEKYMLNPCRVRPETREKIERGIRVLEKYDVMCPKLNYGRCVSKCDGSDWRKNWGDINQDYLKYMWNTCEYDIGFMELFDSLC